MPNEFAGSIPGIKEIDKAFDVMSKVAIKELGGKCSLSMANLIRMMTGIADEKIDESVIQTINLNWETAKVRFCKIGNYPDRDYLQNLVDDLDNWENECTDRSFAVRPAIVGFGLLKLTVHQLLVENADKANDDCENTNSARFYTQCYRILNAIKETQTMLAKIEGKFK